ncbi:unnamed protein product [Trichogramma brassicae]|uniref:Uncharacterized protein n=1 Tax=Trichogramma brassicae TaxID=86971 RepID=A0A6H5IYN2_9HYME|nr:unnamed protein product [Trichogramma brassicae]
MALVCTTRRKIIIGKCYRASFNNFWMPIAEITLISRRRFPRAPAKLTAVRFVQVLRNRTRLSEPCNESRRRARELHQLADYRLARSIAAPPCQCIYDESHIRKSANAAQEPSRPLSRRGYVQVSPNARRSHEWSEYVLDRTKLKRPLRKR